MSIRITAFLNFFWRYIAGLNLSFIRHITEDPILINVYYEINWDIPSGDEYLSPTFKKMFAYDIHEIENRAESWQRLIFQDDLSGVFDKYKLHVESHGKYPFYSEVRYHPKNGSTLWVICTGKVIEWDDNGNAKRMIGCHIDITDYKQAEEEIQKQLSEKETLLKEVHHRIKNNIASIESLLSMQLQSINNPEAISALQDSITRVQGMHILYDKLLLDKDYQEVSIKEYIESLIDAIAAVFSNNCYVTRLLIFFNYS